MGVLALQGAAQSHISCLNRIYNEKEKICAVRTLEELQNCQRLIIPGGESTTILKLLSYYQLFEPLKEYCKTHPIFGSCAGGILLANKVSHPEQLSLKTIDIHAIRNYYGTQLDSFNAEIEICGSLKNFIPTPLKAAFIRAPKFEPLSDQVEILGQYQGYPVLLRQNNILIASFHVELGEDLRLHRYFLRM